jgi:hypothetical protein
LDDGATEECNYSFPLPAHPKDRGSLTHDDRVDAIAGAGAHFQRAMMMDCRPGGQGTARRGDAAEIEDFIERLQPADLWRHADQWVRVQTWSSKRGWSSL